MRLVRSHWVHEYDPTIEDSYSVTRNVDGLPYFLSIIDTAGQEEYRGLWTASTLSSDAFILVYDITNPSSLGTLDHFMDMIHMEAEQRVEDNNRLRKEVGKKRGHVGQVGLPPIKIVAGNKCDLRGDRAVTSREGLEYARKHGCGFMETSAREMVNIEETLAHLVRRVVEARLQSHREGSHPGTEPSTHTLPPTVDALADKTRSQRSRAWGLIKRKRTEPSEEQGQERSEPQNGPKQKERYLAVESDLKDCTETWAAHVYLSG
ncbi:hypothetical protein N7457_006070 [Penicillium paradoxum]|uniref:uncharacterized protein n=1 Tax=Penicillium paradoxum TaxID=176176 RepID=UPI002548461B|nr:uncharacterized protein N7457_006070 [Penicillium paradoxum]KAJ5780910.1 hypothetical protein N7457_006070 [Penicillium paradoxum]